MKSFVQKTLLVLVLLASTVTLAEAAATTPDPAANPILANIIKMGAKMYYLGTRDGLDGWFIVKDGRVQIAYSTADKKAVLIGAMFGENGESISSVQVKALLDSNKEVAALMENASREQQSINQVGTPVAPPAAVAAAPAAPMPTVSLSPGERLYQELSAASGVTLGSGKPQILMVMDVNCPHCQATWRVLRDAVMKNTVQLRMIPIAAPDSDNERAGGQLLHAADPMTAWDKYVAGDKAQLAGVPDAPTIAALRANHTLIDNWKINQTPYMVYRGKDGKVKIVAGEPEKVSAILTDLVP